MREFVFLLAADIDIQEAYEFYEDYQEGRGTVFLNHLDTAFTYVRNFPEIAPLFYGSYRAIAYSPIPLRHFLRNRIGTDNHRGSNELASEPLGYTPSTWINQKSRPTFVGRLFEKYDGHGHSRWNAATVEA